MRHKTREILRSARDLMNENGRHWIKGDMKSVIDEETGEVGFCSWGGIEEITGDDVSLQIPAMEALVKTVNPQGWQYYLSYKEDVRESFETDEGMGWSSDAFEDAWEGEIDVRYDILGDMIAVWNDAPETTWEMVRSAFTRAAKSLR